MIVNEDLSAMAEGIDPQLEAVTQIKKLLKEKAYTMPQHHLMKNVIKLSTGAVVRDGLFCA